MAAVYSRSSWTVSVAMALCVSGVSQASQGDDASLKYHTISVTGTGKIAAKPDLGEFTAGVLTQAPTAKDALAANNDAMNRLHEVLKQRGVAPTDIQTWQLEISPRVPRHQPDDGFILPRIVGYQVENKVRVVTRELDKLGPLLDALVQAGANQISDISFRVENEGALLDKARKRAMADARHKAKVLADASDLLVGPPLKIVEHSDSLYDEPTGGEKELAMFPAGRSTPIAPGEQALSVTVSVAYELKAAK